MLWLRHERDAFEQCNTPDALRSAAFVAKGKWVSRRQPFERTWHG